MKKIILKDILANGEEIAKEVRELSEEETKGYKSIGKGYGNSFGFCLYMAHQHCKNFRGRVLGYRIVEDDAIKATMEQAMNSEYMSVEFFEIL